MSKQQRKGSIIWRCWKDDVWETVILTAAVGLAMLIFMGITGVTL